MKRDERHAAARDKLPRPIASGSALHQLVRLVAKEVATRLLKGRTDTGAASQPPMHK